MTPTNNNPDQEFNISRRKTLGTLSAFGVLGVTGLVSCGGSSSGGSSSSASSAASTTSNSGITSSASCTLIPTETIGPFPLSTLLNNSAVLREAINEDKTGVPLTVKLKLVDVNNKCAPVSGYVYIWHCDKDGFYSGYSENNNAG
ncbi:MAG: protocatechuate dioxygenase, partial [Cellvibrio sp.]